ncbi:MAG: pathogenicity locus [Bacteroidetes bacterium]|nr:pathogenicity locus [Bacteroidota bacterium]
MTSKRVSRTAAAGTAEALHRARVRELRAIPGVGSSIANDLIDIGITSLQALKGCSPDDLYDRSNRVAGVVQDRCLLYVFRCAVYFAEQSAPDPEMLKWWNWSDENLAKQGKRAVSRKGVRRRVA